MVGTITSFPPKVMITEVSETTDGLPYFAKVEFDHTFGEHENHYDGGINIKNLSKATQASYDMPKTDEISKGTEETKEQKTGAKDEISKGTEDTKNQKESVIARLQKKAERLGHWDFDRHDPIWVVADGEDGKKVIRRNKQ
jgi:hypothetical protein